MKTVKILKNVIFSFVFVSLMSLPPSASAQDDRRFINISDVPAEGARLEDFVPRGWVIEERTTGDLNRDGRPDTVLGLIEDLPNETSEGMLNPRHRALVALFRTEGNRFRRAAVAPRLLRCTGCGGMLSRPANSSETIEIQNGVLVISEGYGSRDATDYTLRFRHDAGTNRFVLIGVDSSERDRLTGVSSSTSTNYLTNQSVTRRYRMRRGSVRLVSTSRQRATPPAQRFLEDVDFENY
jgi:hypothetical protein